jgi:hypothetical protein
MSAFAHAAPGVAHAAGGSTLNRPEDPVVLTGADVPSLAGIAPVTLVAFKYDAGAWQQIPVQVDERTLRDFYDIFNGASPSHYTTLVYADANTFTGADADPTLDSNDEIAFMAKDAGGVPPSFSEPAGAISGTGLAVNVTDPTDAGKAGTVYLFKQDGSLDPAAGQQYVTYNFNLLSGSYLSTYRTSTALGLYPNGNPENSTITTPNYARHFGDRWQDDAMSITAGGATGVDILDRHKAMFAPGQCGRSEDTFDGYVNTLPLEAAFVANKSGPVRAIRSYIGANSGPNTQREHVYYAQREDIRTYLRVHAIPSIMDFWDYASAASGMTYYNDLNTGGIAVNGVPDAPAAGAFLWQMVAGPQGAVVMAGNVSTNISGFAYTSYYLDKTGPLSGAEFQCTGDADSYGASGVYINQAIPCTDPGTGCTNYLTSTSTLYFEAPSTTVAMAQALDVHASVPLAYAVQAWLDPAADSDGDGVTNATDNCPTVVNAGQQNNDRNFIDLPASIAFDDATRPNSDTTGDACDADDDNDGLTDAAEGALGPGHASHALCPTATADTDPLKEDADGDRFLDGAECALSYDPASAASHPALIPAGDTDRDGLTDAFEILIGTNAATVDTDGDGLSDGVEYRFYNTNPAATNTDADVCADGKEVATVDNNSTVGASDLGLVAAAFGPLTSGKYIVDFDANKDGAIGASDLGFVAARFGACP